MFLVGAQLLYDGQAERALRFFDRAKELNQGDALPLPLAADNLGAADAARVQPVAAPAGPARPAAKKRQDEPPAVF
jgi:hypothetical protein